MANVRLRLKAIDLDPGYCEWVESRGDIYCLTTDAFVATYELLFNSFAIVR
jgi:hypothetical protein